MKPNLPHFRAISLTVALAALLHGGVASAQIAGTATNLSTEVRILNSNPGSVQYVNFNITQAGTFQLDALGGNYASLSLGPGYNGDPYIQLFRDSLALINFVEADDDGGVGFDSRIIRSLAGGRYILAVHECCYGPQAAVDGIPTAYDPNTLIRVLIRSDDGRAVLIGQITLQELQRSLGTSAVAGNMMLSAVGTLLNGAHSRPLSRRVPKGENTFWLAGDWGTDHHGSRSGDLGLAEVGFGRNFGPVQLNISLGQTWAKQNLDLDGRAKVGGAYLLAETLIPVGGNLWAVLSGYAHRGDADLRRGYFNAGVQDSSTAKPNVHTWGVRARLEMDNAWQIAGAEISPYGDLSYSKAKLDAYTETGGGFPARFDSRKDKATELRVGANAVKSMGSGMKLVGTLEVAHRFEKNGARTSGEVIGVSGFDLAGQGNRQDWLRAGIGVEGKLAEGQASLSLNVTTNGETPNAWVAASWQKAF